MDGKTGPAAGRSKLVGFHIEPDPVVSDPTRDRDTNITRASEWLILFLS